MLKTCRVNPLDLAVRQVAVAAIKGYQQYISPYKGFSCAHRVLYGGESCSGYVKHAIAAQGLLEALSSAGERFQACKAASLILRSQQSESEKKKRRLENYCQNPLDSCQCAECGCEACTQLSCESCITVPDCSVLDCGSLDCTSCCGSGVFAPLNPRLLGYIKYRK